MIRALVNRVAVDDAPMARVRDKGMRRPPLGNHPDPVFETGL